jgi:hypothetical protein
MLSRNNCSIQFLLGKIPFGQPRTSPKEPERHMESLIVRLGMVLNQNWVGVLLASSRQIERTGFQLSYFDNEGVKMSKTIEISIRCLHCRQWFKSPIWFGDSESFDTSTLLQNVTPCPHCKKMTGCDKKNFRARFEDGGLPRRIGLAMQKRQAILRQPALSRNPCS